MEILELKIIVTELKKILMMGLQQNIGDQKKKKISEPEDRTIEITQPEQQRDNILKNKNKQSVRYLWDKNRISNISVLEEKEKED